VYNVYIKNQFQTTSVQGRGGGVKSVSIEVTENSKEEDFCPNYVQEFGLWPLDKDLKTTCAFFSLPRIFVL
jgi:hypothetical protein